ncbi:MAG: hypothetical protein HY820_28790 [Acidobacteria bacterium]|nr:hypothetical protein [Acidobacteriota bacterium]
MPEMNDDELSRMLREWKAPATPKEIQQRVMAAAEPVPVVATWRGWAAVALAAAAVVLLVVLVMRTPRRPSTLADFEPVKELQPRVIKSGYEEVK